VIGRPLLYRRLPSPLHATRASVAALWAVSLLAAALVLYHPLALLALLLAVLGAGRGAGVGRALLRALRTTAIVAVPIVLVNVLVSREGLTVFARLGDLGPFGQGDLTVEAVVYGAVIALKVTLLILVTTLASLAIDPDEMLRGFRRLSFRSALTATLATRMLPVLASDSQRLAEAQRTRPDGGPRGARGRIALLGAVVGGSLDRAMDVAATLEVRGYAAARRRTRQRRGAARGPRHAHSRHDLAFAASAGATLALALLGRLSSFAAFDSYPRVEMRVDGGTLVLCAALLAAVLLPFCDRRGVER
jgi:energy-coupling factor transport system permease protein